MYWPDFWTITAFENLTRVAKMTALSQPNQSDINFVLSIDESVLSVLDSISIVQIYPVVDREKVYRLEELLQDKCEELGEYDELCKTVDYWRLKIAHIAVSAGIESLPKRVASLNLCRTTKDMQLCACSKDSRSTAALDFLVQTSVPFNVNFHAETPEDRSLGAAWEKLREDFTSAAQAYAMEWVRRERDELVSLDTRVRSYLWESAPDTSRSVALSEILACMCGSRLTCVLKSSYRPGRGDAAISKAIEALIAYTSWQLLMSTYIFICDSIGAGLEFRVNMDSWSRPEQHVRFLKDETNREVIDEARDYLSQDEKLECHVEFDVDLRQHSRQQREHIRQGRSWLLRKAASIAKQKARESWDSRKRPEGNEAQWADSTGKTTLVEPASAKNGTSETQRDGWHYVVQNQTEEINELAPGKPRSVPTEILETEIRPEIIEHSGRSEKPRMKPKIVVDSQADADVMKSNTRAVSCSELALNSQTSGTATIEARNSNKSVIKSMGSVAWPVLPMDHCRRSPPIERNREAKETIIDGTVKTRTSRNISTGSRSKRSIVRSKVTHVTKDAPSPLDSCDDLSNDQSLEPARSSFNGRQPKVKGIKTTGKVIDTITSNTTQAPSSDDQAAPRIRTDRITRSQTNASAFIHRAGSDSGRN